MCYDDGIFQEIIDEEYEGNLKEVYEHIENCGKCKRRFEELQREELFISEKLDASFRIPKMRKIDLEYQLFKFYKREKGRNKMNSKVRKLAASAAALAIVIGAMSYAPIRVKAADLLNVFRVNEVTGISINDNDIRKIGEAFDKGNGKVDLKDFISVDTKSNEEPINISQGEISKETVKKYIQDAQLIPIDDSLEYSYMTIHPETDLTLKFNVSKVNDFLQYLGEDARLPKEMDEKDFIIHAGKSISYSVDSKKDGKGKKYINVTQIGTPTLTLPEGVNQKEIVDSLLSLKLLPQNIKEQLANIGDLTETLQVPYSEEHDIKKDITVKGQKAILIQSKDNSYNNMQVVFKKGDSLFVVSANGYSLEEVTKLLEAME